MNNKYSVLLIVTLIFLFSCRKGAENLSKLTNESSGNFIITSIQAGPDGEVMCVGFIKDTDSSVILRYNRNLKLLQTLYPSRMPEFQGKLKLTCLQDQGWLIGSFSLTPTPRRSVFLADRNFNITAKVINGYSASTILRIHELKPLRNGDFLMVMDSFSNFGLRNDIRIERLDPQLKSIFRYKTQRLSPYSARTFEMPDESIFFTYLNQDSFKKVGSVYQGFNILRLGTGVLEKNGRGRFHRVILPEATHMESIGLSYTGHDLILNTIINDEHIQHYYSIDAANGLIKKESSLGFNYINNQIVTSYYNGHFPLGEANQLPEQLKPGQGHFIYSEVDKKLYFLSVDENLNLSLRFPLLLPEFSEIFSYRQLFTDKGTMIVGTSYAYKDKNYFNLQEVTMDGKVVK